MKELQMWNIRETSLGTGKYIIENISTGESHIYECYGQSKLIGGQDVLIFLNKVIVGSIGSNHIITEKY